MKIAMKEPIARSKKAKLAMLASLRPSAITVGLLL